MHFVVQGAKAWYELPTEAKTPLPISAAVFKSRFLNCINSHGHIFLMIFVNIVILYRTFTIYPKHMLLPAIN